MSTSPKIEAFYQLIAKDNLQAGFELLTDLVKGSPQLKEVLQQAGRYEDLRNRVRRGLLTAEEESVSKNQIRQALLDLAQEIETGVENSSTAQEEVRSWLAQNAGNFVSDSGATAIGGQVNIQGEYAAGRDIHIGKSQDQSPKRPWWKRLFS